MLRILLLNRKYLLIVAICVSSVSISGCIESSFNLASESKLPKSMSLPPGIARSDVSVSLNLYTPLRGPDAKFVLKDKKGKKLAEVKGRTKGSTRSTYYQIVTDKGITEIIQLRPYRAHENMEQNGRAVALFNVIDDATVR